MRRHVFVCTSFYRETITDARETWVSQTPVCKGLGESPAMVQDDPFEPKLGKIRHQRLKAPKGFRARVLQASHRNGGPKMMGINRGPSASKRGRGGGVARVVTTGRWSGGGRRRVIVKARYPSRNASRSQREYRPPVSKVHLSRS
jgi:hypothetical protein